MKTYTVFVESNYINVANFFVFEVFMISAVFFLTSDISGRLNHFSLKLGDTKRIFVLSPPLLGGGLCSTNIVRASIMLALRAFSILIILGTALSMEGRTIDVRDSRRAMVLAPAPVNVSKEARPLFEAARSRRGSCQITYKGFLYFGIIYADKRLGCEFDVRSLGNQIKIKTDAEKISFNATGCIIAIQKSKLRDNYYVEQITCPLGRISCDVNRGRRRPQSCRAVVTVGKKDYACSSFESRKGGVYTGNCNQAINIAQAKDYWTQAWRVSGANHLDRIGATTVLGTEMRTVWYYKKKQVTEVAVIWIVWLFIDILLIIALATHSIFLRCRGSRCILHDENSLIDLLKTSTRDRSTMVSHQDAVLYLNSKWSTRGKTLFWVSSTPTRRDENETIHEKEKQYY